MSVSRLLSFLVIIWLLWAFSYFRHFFASDTAHEIVFCDVGQGDAIFIRDGDREILVDGGPDESVLRCLAAHMPLGDNTIELMVLSHPDADHFTGLTSVLGAYQVSRLVINNVGKATADYFAFYSAVSAEISSGMQVISPVLGDLFCVSDRVCVEVVSNFREIFPLNIFAEPRSFGFLNSLFFDFIPSSYNYNNGSIVLNLYFDNISVLLSGDAETSEELALLADGLLTDIDVLKMGHHGSKTSSSPSFLAKVRPEIAVVSCGRNNQFGHPHTETLAHMDDLGAHVYRTDQQGEIVYRCTDSGQCAWSTARDPP